MASSFSSGAVRTLRTFIAVFVAYLFYAWTIDLLFERLQLDRWTAPEPRLVLLCAAYGAVLALAAGYLATLIAGGGTLRQARLLGLTVALAALIAGGVRLEQGSSMGWWYPVSMLGAPASLLGGLFRLRHARRRVGA